MVFPLYDDNPFKRARVPYVTWGLIALNVIIFLCKSAPPTIPLRHCWHPTRRRRRRSRTKLQLQDGCRRSLP